MKRIYDYRTGVLLESDTPDAPKNFYKLNESAGSGRKHVIYWDISESMSDPKIMRYVYDNLMIGPNESVDFIPFGERVHPHYDVMFRNLDDIRLKDGVDNETDFRQVYAHMSKMYSDENAEVIVVTDVSGMLYDGSLVKYSPVSRIKYFVFNDTNMSRTEVLDELSSKSESASLVRYTFDVFGPKDLNESKRISYRKRINESAGSEACVMEMDVLDLFDKINKCPDCVISGESKLDMLLTDFLCSDNYENGMTVQDFMNFIGDAQYDFEIDYDCICDGCCDGDECEKSDEYDNFDDDAPVDESVSKRFAKYRALYESEDDEKKEESEDDFSFDDFGDDNAEDEKGGEKEDGKEDGAEEGDDNEEEDVEFKKIDITVHNGKGEECKKELTGETSIKDGEEDFAFDIPEDDIEVIEGEDGANDKVRIDIESNPDNIVKLKDYLSHKKKDGEPIDLEKELGIEIIEDGKEGEEDEEGSDKEGDKKDKKESDDVSADDFDFDFDMFGGDAKAEDEKK